MKLKDKLKLASASSYFLVVIIVIYGLLSIFNSGVFSKALNSFSKIIVDIIPVFVFVFVLMTLTNYFITPKFIIRHLKGKGIKKWFFVIIGGILSTGPIYMWYPLLSDLKQRGLNYGFIACFLYNRSIKIAILPIAILYFGWKYVLILSVVMILVSVIQALLINKLMNGGEK